MMPEPSSILPAEIEIKVTNGLIIPITATLLDQDAEDPILSIFCYTSTKGIKLLLKINKTILQTSFQHKDIFQSSQAYYICTHGEILEKSINDYLSILVTKITISPNSVFLSNELIDHFNIEQDTVVKLEQFQSKSPDRTMEMSSLLPDTSVYFNDDFDDTQYADRDDFSQHSNNSLEEIPREETIMDENLIKPLDNLTKETDMTIETDRTSPGPITDQLPKPLEPIILIDKCLSSSQDQPSAPVDLNPPQLVNPMQDRSIETDEASVDSNSARLPLEPIIVIDKYISSSQDHPSPEIAFNQPQLVDPMQDRSIETDETSVDSNSVRLPLEPIIVIDKYISSSQDQPSGEIAFNPPHVVDPVQDVSTKELDQVAGKGFTQQEGEGSKKDIFHSMNLTPEKEAQEQEKTKENDKQENIYRHKGFIARKNFTEERLQDRTTSERVQEDRVERLPAVHQTPSIAEKNSSYKVRVYKRRKRHMVDPEELRRSPRLALKKRVQYYPIKRKNNKLLCLNIAIL